MKTNISKKRKELKITQQELADIVDVTRQTIISLEHGKYNPSLILALKIKKALKVKMVEELFEFEEEDEI